MQWSLGQRSIESVCGLLTARQGEDIPRIEASAEEIPQLQEIGQEGRLLTITVIRLRARMIALDDPGVAQDDPPSAQPEQFQVKP